MSDEQAFVDIAQTSIATAQRYLEAAGGDLDMALAAYYAEEGGSGPSGAGGAGPSAGPSHGSGSRPIAGSSSGPAPSGPFSGSRPFGGSSRARQTRSDRSRVQSFGDLASRQDNDNSSDDEDNRLFTGGEKSGLAVQNPDDQASQAAGSSRGVGGRFSAEHQLVGRIISKAQQAGPPEGYDEPDTPANTFAGSGFRLGDSQDQSQEIQGEEQEKVPERVKRTIYFWQDGFSVDDGPLYRYDDPANVRHLQSINAGRAPLDVLGVVQNQYVDVQIDQRVDQPYKAPKRPPGFSGAGTRLGTTGPHLSGASSRETTPAPILASSSASTSAPASSTTNDAAGASAAGPGGDTTVQVRLGNGQAHRARFAGDGPVQQLYDYVDALNGGRSYVLNTTFPMKALTDKTQSIKNAGLANAVVVQRYS